MQSTVKRRIKMSKQKIIHCRSKKKRKSDSERKPKNSRRNPQPFFTCASACSDYSSRLPHKLTFIRHRRILPYEKICFLDRIAFDITDDHHIFFISSCYHFNTFSRMFYIGEIIYPQNIFYAKNGSA